MPKVKATREGLPGAVTSSGYVIESHVPFVALPCTHAIGRALRVSNPKNGRSIVALVLDVGPWNTNDMNYVFMGGRPQAETGVDMTGRKTNGAGIDLGEKVWSYLGMLDNGDVEWAFIG